jgi:rhodanese-related sulfurtransferase
MNMDMTTLFKDGAAVVVDVRTPGEFMGGHVAGSTNIPLNELPARLQQVKTMSQGKTLVLCCASGMRSASARTMLASNGFMEVYNGGSWYNLRKFEK